MSEAKGVQVAPVLSRLLGAGAIVLALAACSSAPDSSALTPAANSPTPTNSATPLPPAPSSTPPAPESRASALSATKSASPTPSAKVKEKEADKQKPKSEPPAPEPKCDPNYENACVPIVPSDLDCGDISEMVIVIGQDIHGFDADGDGRGCESYG